MLHYGVYCDTSMIVPEKRPPELKREFRSGLDKFSLPWHTLVIGIIALARLKETNHEL